MLRKFDNDTFEKYKKLSSILAAIKEQRMLGILCGINQGMDTSDFDEYNNVRTIEKYINKKYRQYMEENSDAKFVPFNFITFLTNPIEQEEQIKQYEMCAETYNILDIVTRVPHYNAMLKLIATNRYLIQRSVALTMERELANKILNADKLTKKGEINVGETMSFNERE
jgi:biotin-(acetyl-CoA carboxylase) ligase